MSNDPVNEMLWDCKFCGTTKLLGKSQKFCPVCGAAQDTKTRYFPSDEEKIAVHDHKFVGADLICPACSTANSGNSEFCTQCGAPLERAERATTLDQQARAEGEKFVSSGPRDLAKEQMTADLSRAEAAERQQKSKARRPFIIGGVAVAIIAIIAAVVFLFSTTKEGVRVTGHSWERGITIEDYGPRSEAAWRDGVPGDARGISCTRKQRSTRQVADGQECHTVRVDQGDGTYREQEQCTTKYRDEPVYDDWCSYTVDRWAYVREVTASGNSLAEEPFWPPTNITQTGSNCYGCEREGSKSEKYVVHLKASDSDKTYDCDYDQAKWASLSIESVWQMEVRRTGSPVCDTLKKPE